MRLIYNYLGCGRVKDRKSINCFDFLARTQADVFNVVIPFFQKYRLHTVKYLDYVDFCKGANIIKSDIYRTETGVAALRTLKNGMNTGRIF